MHDIYERFTLRENFYANQESCDVEYWAGGVVR